MPLPYANSATPTIVTPLDAPGRQKDLLVVGSVLHSILSRNETVILEPTGRIIAAELSSSRWDHHLRQGSGKHELSH